MNIADVIDVSSLNSANAAKRISNDLQKIDLRFKLREELIYYTNFNNERKRLYILNSLKKKVFELIYDR